MRSEFTFFSKQAIVEFLAEHGKEGSKDYEFAAALIICRLCERRWDEDCWIGVRIQSKYHHALPAYNSQREIILDEVTQFLKKGVDEDSPVDFVVAKRADMKKAQGTVFQVKRFGIGRDANDTSVLVNYVNSLTKKYGKTDVNLLLCLDDHVSVNMETFYREFDTNLFPFNRLLFTWVSDDDVFLQDIHPKGERETFKMNELFTTN